MKLQWHKKKEERPISSPTQKETPEILREITQEKDMRYIPMETSTTDSTLTAKEQGKENTSTPMVIATKAHSSTIKNMELVASSPKIKDSTMVHTPSFRTMGKWDQAWIRNIRLCKQRLLLRMVDVR